MIGGPRSVRIDPRHPLDGHELITRHVGIEVEGNERALRDVAVAMRPLVRVQEDLPAGPQEPDGRALWLAIRVDGGQPADDVGLEVRERARPGFRRRIGTRRSAQRLRPRRRVGLGERTSSAQASAAMPMSTARTPSD